MNRKDIYEAIGQADSDMLERSEKDKKKEKSRRTRWAAAVAAVLVIAVISAIALNPHNAPLVTTAYAVSEAAYPKMAPYPNEDAPSFDQDYDAWWESVQAQRREQGYADGLEPFFASGIRQFLSGTDKENRACSPLNIYMALGMLAELTGGGSRQQILDLLGADSIEALRSQAGDVWNAHYRDDGATTSILASSLWLNQDISFVQSTLDTLSDTYYASSFQGEMGSEGFDDALRTWLNEQTGGMLKEQTEGISLDSRTVLALASTLYFQARWQDEFNKNRTEAGIFHSAAGDETCDFMHSSNSGIYYWGERFGAVTKNLSNGGGTMLFILPDEGTSADELLSDDEAMNFILSRDEWENTKHLIINLALPKFDITSQMDLNESLKALGVTDVFDSEASTFTPMTSDMDGIYVSKTQHDVRVVIDEEGVTAASYTLMAAAGAGMPPSEEMDFVLDRPFLFVLDSNDGLPLFVGIVNQP